MHLSRFITIAICAMTFMGAPALVDDLLGTAPDHGDLVALVTGGSDVVERERVLGVAADEVARFDQQPGDRVVDAASLAAGLGPRYVDDAVLGVVHVHGSRRHPRGYDGPSDDDAVAVDRLDPVVVGHPD